MIKSTATKRSEQLGNWSEWAAKKTNSEFFTAAFEAMEKFKVGNQGLMTIGLIGSRDIPGVTLRRAQSIIRWDRRPGLWSHAFLIGKAWKGKGKVDAVAACATTCGTVSAPGSVIFGPTAKDRTPCEQAFRFAPPATWKWSSKPSDWISSPPHPSATARRNTSGTPPLGGTKTAIPIPMAPNASTR